LPPCCLPAPLPACLLKAASRQRTKAGKEQKQAGERQQAGSKGKK